MFELGRELKRLFRADAAEGMAAGDASLLELLDLTLLRAEGRSALLAASGAARDNPRRQLDAAVVWREVARRTGDSAPLRQAAALAERAADGFDRIQRPKAWAEARAEQARCALLGAELFGDDGLNAAAQVALTDARAAAGPGSAAAALAEAGLWVVEARKALAGADQAAVLALAARLDGPVRILRAQGRRNPDARLQALELRLIRADLLCAAGQRLKEPTLLRRAYNELGEDLDQLDAAYEPLSWARAAMLRGAVRAALAELEVDLGELAASITDLAQAIDNLDADHSPLDWARGQQVLGGVLQMLGEAADSDRAFDQAVGCYDRALLVLVDQPALAERAHAIYHRAVCLARKAEIRCDLRGLDEAESALRAELAGSGASRDPVGWAVRQLNFARLYEARMGVTGRDRGERAASAVALSAALDVFGEHGLRTLADTAARRLEELRVG